MLKDLPYTSFRHDMSVNMDYESVHQHHHEDEPKPGSDTHHKQKWTKRLPHPNLHKTLSEFSNYTREPSAKKKTQDAALETPLFFRKRKLFLMPHQIEGLKFLRASLELHRGCILADEMGKQNASKF